MIRSLLIFNNLCVLSFLFTSFVCAGETKLPLHHRQKINNGTLEIVQVEKSSDESAYTCQVFARGKKTQATFYVNVIGKLISVCIFYPNFSYDIGFSTPPLPQPTTNNQHKKKLIFSHPFQTSLVKPTIEPFEFPKHLREGQRASVTCTVSSGDLPICLNWYHQGLVFTFI